jgi:hypothetical protein
MRTHPTKLAALWLAAVLLGGCDNHDGHDGPMQTQTRELSGFNAIDMEGAARLEISVGSPYSVELEAPAEVLERVKTEIRGETLAIESRAKDWFPSGGRARVTLRISTPELTSLRLGGGNDVVVQGYAGGESSIKVEGAANIEARGELESLVVRMSGAGQADLSELIAARVKVTVDGVGTAVVHANDALDATMNGVGAIHYIGDPREVSTRMNGVGTIGKKEWGKQAPRDGEPSKDEEIEINPDKLQPEYEDKGRTKDVTDVV